MSNWINIVSEENAEADYSSSLGYIQGAPRVIAKRTSNGIEWREAADAYTRANGLTEIGVNCMWCGGAREIISATTAPAAEAEQASGSIDEVEIVAHIPAREFMGRQLQAREDRFVMDADGRWTYASEGNEPLLEREVVELCQKASNWPQIKREHFPMHGFHS